MEERRRKEEEEADRKIGSRKPRNLWNHNGISLDGNEEVLTNTLEWRRKEGKKEEMEEGRRKEGRDDDRKGGNQKSRNLAMRNLWNNMEISLDGKWRSTEEHYWNGAMRSRRIRCARSSLLSASDFACVSLLSTSADGLRSLFGRAVGARRRGHGRATQWSRSAVSAWMKVDSDAGFELSGHYFPPSG